MTADTTIIRSSGVLGDSVTTKPPPFTCITFLYFTQYFHSTLLPNFHNKSIRLEGRHFYSHFRDEEAGAQRGKIYSPKSKHRQSFLHTRDGKYLATPPSFLAQDRHHKSITALFPPCSDCTSGSFSTQPFWWLVPVAQTKPVCCSYTTSCQLLNTQPIL